MANLAYILLAYSKLPQVIEVGVRCHHILLPHDHFPTTPPSLYIFHQNFILQP